MTNPAATQNKEIDCLSPEAQRLAEARLAAKRAARAEARDIRMKELERQQKEASDEDERASVGSRGSLRTNGYDGGLYGSQSLSRRSGRNSSCSGDGRPSTLCSSREEKSRLSCCDLGLPRGGRAPKAPSAQDGSRPSYLYSSARPDGSDREPVLADGSLGGARRGSACSSHAPSEHSGHRNPSSRTSSRASSARASPVVEERPEKDFTEKGSRSLPGLSAATLASLGGPSSRRGSAETSTSIDTEASIREIKELNDLKGQIQDVEGRYMQGLKEMKDSLAEVEEKYKRAMVSNAQLDNEKTNFMYQVDTLKEVLLELEEQLAEARRQHEEQSRELEREKHAHGLLRFQLAEATAALRQRDEMLEEIRQLQQKQASYIREVSDLQETIEWKDKKIGALERQKEFFDSIRSERDDLREEVVALREELKKHGIILNSEVAANGEASDTLNDVGCQGATKVTREELNAIKATADGTLGRANEVEVNGGIVENVGKREILQNTKQEQRKEDPMKDCVDAEALHPDEQAEDQKTPEDTAPSPGTLADATDGDQVQSQSLESTSLLERTEQVGSDEVVSTPGGRSEPPLAQSRCLGELDSGSPGPRLGEVSRDALDSKNQSEKPAKRQEQETQDFKTSVGEVSTKPHQEFAPLPISEVERVTSSDSGDPSGSPTPGAAGAGLTGLGEQVGTVASSPPRCSSDTASHEEECVADVLIELDSSTEGGLEKELASQRAAGPRTGEARRGLLGVKEPSEESNDPPGEALDSSQKKSKNKKKRNKKKKSPAPVETPQEVRKELTFQTPAPSDSKEGGQVTPTEKKSGGETQNEATENPGHDMVAGSREHVDCAENPKIESGGQLNGDDREGHAESGDVAADGEPLPFEDATAEASGTSAGGDRELGEAIVKGAAGDGATPGSPAEPADASQAEGADGRVVPECPTQRAGEPLDGIGLGDHDAAPAGPLGDLGSEGKEDARGRNEDKSREDCALS
ncbi:leucine-rich repeat flightless-interacting protein 1-like isoform X3 [Pteropus medius]|uniref:leucine-rich repeat flightless-interacting protein 1-like isoform X3 n=1 Tax=Pteropus vampyrus TaxID=132908 RepID=UPI00196A6D50|nr:leucine-rich repeat flightless-interacting protein 1-like isoform X3 [Pteropus giganteus]